MGALTGFLLAALDACEGGVSSFAAGTSASHDSGDFLRTDITPLVAWMAQIGWSRKAYSATLAGLLKVSNIWGDFSVRPDQQGPLRAWVLLHLTAASMVRLG